MIEFGMSASYTVFMKCACVLMRIQIFGSCPSTAIPLVPGESTFCFFVWTPPVVPVVVTCCLFLLVLASFCCCFFLSGSISSACSDCQTTWNPFAIDTSLTGTSIPSCLMTISNTWSSRPLITKSAFRSCLVFCKLTVTSFAPFFLATNGRSPTGLICRVVPRQRTRSAWRI